MNDVIKGITGKARPLVDFIKKRILRGTAIYITDDFIDVVRGEMTLKGMKITYLHRLPVVKDMKNRSYAESAETIDSVLEKAIDFEKDKPYRVAVNLKNDYFLLRWFTFMQISEKELENAVLFEAQKFIPYAIDDLTFTFKRCAKKEGTLEIIFAATEKKNINELTKYFSEKNIVPSIVAPMPILISKALSLDGKIKKDKAYISLHYEPTNRVTVTGIWRDFPYFFREINIFAAEDEFKTTELGYPALKDIWGVISNDVHNAMEYLKKETKESIEKVFISGFSPTPTEEEVSQEVGIPFQRASLLLFKGAPNENRDRYIPALSLIYETLHTPLLNLAGKEMIYKDIWTFKPVAQKAGILFCIILALHIFLTGANIIKKNEIKNVKRKFDIYKIISPEATTKEVTAKKDLMKEKAEFINKALMGKIYLTEKMNVLSKKISPDIWVESIEFLNSVDGKTKSLLRIMGGVYARGGEGVKQINNFIKKLKQDKEMMAGFADIKLVTAKKRMIHDEELTEFEFVMK